MLLWWETPVKAGLSLQEPDGRSLVWLHDISWWHSTSLSLPHGFHSIGFCFNLITKIKFPVHFFKETYLMFKLMCGLRPALSRVVAVGGSSGIKSVIFFKIKI